MTVFYLSIFKSELVLEDDFLSFITALQSNKKTSKRKR